MYYKTTPTEYAHSKQQAHLGRPVGETLLLGIHELMRRAARLTEPVLVCLLIGDTVTITALQYLLQVIDTVPQHLSCHVSQDAVHWNNQLHVIGKNSYKPKTDQFAC
jgi:hypothetical protein